MNEGLDDERQTRRAQTSSTVCLARPYSIMPLCSICELRRSTAA
jgi:hypothetical protein